MKATHSLKTGPAFALEMKRTTSTIFITVALFLVSTAIWQVGKPISNTAQTPYKASSLDLSISGSLNSVQRLSSWDTVDATFSPSGFTLVFKDTPLAFELMFAGSPNAEASIYDLSGGTYPLRLTLLEGGEGYHSFSATQGSVELGEKEATVTAFLSDEFGQQIFVNLRFDWPNAALTCSESYRFCFNTL